MFITFPTEEKEQEVLFLLLCEFFTPVLNDGFFTEVWVTAMSPQVSRTLQSILADFKSAVVWIVLILPLIFSSSCLFSISSPTEEEDEEFFFSEFFISVFFTGFWVTPSFLKSPVVFVSILAAAAADIINNNYNSSSSSCCLNAFQSHRGSFI